MKSQLSSNITPEQGVRPHRPPGHARRIVIAVLCWGYLLLLLALMAVIRTMGDRNWRGTLLLFSPRWPALFPLVILLPLALWGNRRMLIVLTVSIIVGIFPLMGFCVGWHRYTASANTGMPMRIVAFNIHGMNLDRPDVENYYAQIHPDVMAFEEMSARNSQTIYAGETWHVKKFNELLIASKFPIVSATNILQDILAKFTVNTPSGPVDIVVVHLSSPHYALKDAVLGYQQGRGELTGNIHGRSDEAAFLKQLLSKSHGPLIIAGDFNLLPDSPLFTSGFDGMTDAFESVGFGFGWTYENQWTSVRIDHVLTNAFFTPIAFARGPRLGSLHLPIVADVVLKNH